jgi:hypothetical protein
MAEMAEMAEIEGGDGEIAFRSSNRRGSSFPRI